MSIIQHPASFPSEKSRIEYFRKYQIEQNKQEAQNDITLSKNIAAANVGRIIPKEITASTRTEAELMQDKFYQQKLAFKNCVILMGNNETKGRELYEIVKNHNIIFNKHFPDVYDVVKDRLGKLSVEEMQRVVERVITKNMQTGYVDSSNIENVNKVITAISMSTMSQNKALMNVGQKLAGISVLLNTSTPEIVDAMMQEMGIDINDILQLSGDFSRELQRGDEIAIKDSVKEMTDKLEALDTTTFEELADKINDMEDQKQNDGVDIEINDRYIQPLPMSENVSMEKEEIKQAVPKETGIFLEEGENVDARELEDDEDAEEIDTEIVEFIKRLTKKYTGGTPEQNYADFISSFYILKYYIEDRPSKKFQQKEITTFGKVAHVFGQRIEGAKVARDFYEIIHNEMFIPLITDYLKQSMQIDIEEARKIAEKKINDVIEPDVMLGKKVVNIYHIIPRYMLNYPGTEYDFMTTLIELLETKNLGETYSSKQTVDSGFIHISLAIAHELEIEIKQNQAGKYTYGTIKNALGPFIDILKQVKEKYQNIGPDEESKE